MRKTLNDFSARTISGKEISLSEFQNKYVLIVNTASKCGFTPQLDGLEAIYKKYKANDFVILGFPCNQFLKQEPGNEKSIQEGCLLNYGVSFPMFSKIDVNGENSHPLYKWLKSEQKGFLFPAIKWNFTKFLIDKSGNVVKRFGPNEKPEVIESYLKEKYAF